MAPVIYTLQIKKSWDLQKDKLLKVAEEWVMELYTNLGCVNPNPTAEAQCTV